MSDRNPEYQFVSTDTEELEAELVSIYENLTNTSVQPGSPERLIMKWAAYAIILERVNINYTGNQNIPSRAYGANLDALGQLFYLIERPQPKPSFCSVRFTISEAQQFSILVPSGTRVTDSNSTLVWETRADAFVRAGDTYVDILVYCQTAGTIGNGYATGQINTIVDVFDYYLSCANTSSSDGGSDLATDDEYFELLRASQDAFSSAGARGGYIYFAKQVSTQIADVVANTPSPGVVHLFVLMDDGTIASEEIKRAVLAACSADEVRPLTDYVSVEDPETVEYDVSIKYYIPSNSPASSTDIDTAVKAAVEQYNAWQREKLGRDINPDKLMGLLMQTGIKRVELMSPAYKVLSDGSNDTTPQVAKLKSTSIVNGGREDE